LNELETLLGSTTSSTYSFGENNVLADNDAVYAALNKLDLKWGDLGSVANGEGASLVAIEDAGGFTAQTDVEGALQEIYQELLDISPTKTNETTVGVITAGVNHTLPGGLTYTPEATYGANLDVFYQGQLLFPGAGNDYLEVAGAPSTQIKFNFTIPVGRNLQYISRK
jgi:hypothetical protein